MKAWKMVPGPTRLVDPIQPFEIGDEINMQEKVKEMDMNM
jgi:hypothetical protein